MLSLQSSPSSCSQVPRKKYDVFLSFRGEDTRKNFTDHLYAALVRRGIVTFRDDERLEAGESIAPGLLKAIQESWCSIIVLSETYAFSGWCLDELAQIVKQKNDGGLKVFPIFYDVDPSDLRKQTGKVAEAFAKHEERYMGKTQSWRSALTEVANLKGWHRKDRHESEFIGDIVKRIWEKLWQAYSSVPDDLIGMNSRLEKLLSKIDIGKDDIRIIGICGMGGIGKTTLARLVYSQVSPHFEGKSFLSDVRETSDKFGLGSLPKLLFSQIFPEECFNFCDVQEGSLMISHRLSNNRVLIVIDDVDNIQHIKWLAGRRDWFGSGSRIIITTRDEHLLRSFRVDDVYEPTTLDADEALHLFSLKAFNSDTPEDDFIELSKRVVEYAGGIPLALEVFGSFFCGRDAALWRSGIELLKRDSKKEIHERLRISFDGLEETEKNIFLDIACFFGGEKKDFVIKVLDGCGFSPDIGIDTLVKKSLIKVYGDKNKFLWMHHLLQEMGRKIVKQKSAEEPGQRCRLWEERDVYDVLAKNTATEAIEGIHINCWDQRKTISWNVEAFLKMKKLRLLRVSYLPNPCDLNYLSDKLRLLDWSDYPLKSLPSNFQPDNLVALLLPYSHIEQLWKGNIRLEQLKLVNLKGSENLMRTPDFTMAPNLESLILEGCIKIVDVHPSIGLLQRLKVLNLRACKSLRRLPTKIGMKSLETLILSGCSNLERLPDQIDGEMECLVELYLDGTGIRHLPSLIGHLSGLVRLNLKGCRNLASLPSNINGLKCLKILNLSGCSKLGALPETLQQLESLEELNLDGTGIRHLPSLIGHLSGLVRLNLKGCRNLASLPSSMNGLKCLKTLNLSGCSKLESLPESLQQVESLEELDLSETAIRKPPSFFSQFKNLKQLSFRGCKGPLSKSRLNLPFLFQVMQRGRGSLNSVALTLPPLSGLTSLTKLDISYCNLGEGDIPSDICQLSSLKALDLRGNNFISLPANLDRLPNLKGLDLRYCMELKSLPELLRGTCIRGDDDDDNIPTVGVFANAPVCNSIDGACFCLTNCYRLAENTNIVTLLKRHLKACANFTKQVSIILPGSEIPEWFSHQRDGCSVKIPLPRHLRNDSRFIGVAFCCVFVNAVTIRCKLLDSEHELPSEHSALITKDHLRLLYWSRDMLYPSSDKCGETEHLSSPESDVPEFEVEVEVEVNELPWSRRSLCKGIVKKCGVRIVYEEDLELEEMEQIIKGRHIPQIDNTAFDEFKTGEGGGALVKRKRNFYDPSESDSIQETPQPKRLEQILNCIMPKKHKFW